MKLVLLFLLLITIYAQDKTHRCYVGNYNKTAEKIITLLKVIPSSLLPDTWEWKNVNGFNYLTLQRNYLIFVEVAGLLLPHRCMA